MPLGASRLSLLALPQVEAVAASRGVLNVYGDTQVDTSKKVFGTGSALFDGTGDYMEFIPTNDYSLYTGNFTIECWFLAEADTGSATGTIASNRSGGYGARDYMILYRNFDNKVNIPFKAWDPATSTIQDVLGGLSVVVTPNTWNHVAFGYDGSRYSCWLNGTRFDTDTANASGQEIDFENFWIAAQDNGSTPFNAGGGNGQIDEFRVSLVDRYGVNNSSISVPTSAFTNDSDTLLLLHMDGADGSTTFEDDNSAAVSGRTAKTITASGDAQVSTAQSKFGTGSLYSDGTTDYLSVTADSDFVFGSNDFTLEAWVRPASTGVGSGDQIISKWSGSNGYSFGLTYGTSSPKNNIRALINDTGGIRGFQVISNPLTVNAWNHVALVVESGTLALYANGNRIGTTSVTAFNDATNADVTISALSGGSYSPNHYQDEIRISDTARYSGSTYTVPSAAFTNDANTLLLLHCDGTNGSTTFTDDNS